MELHKCFFTEVSQYPYERNIYPHVTGEETEAGKVSWKLRNPTPPYSETPNHFHFNYLSLSNNYTVQ